MRSPVNFLQLLLPLLVVGSLNASGLEVISGGQRQGWFPGFVYRLKYDFYQGWYDNGGVYYNPQDTPSSDSIWILVPQSGSPSGSSWAYTKLADESKVMAYLAGEGFTWCTPDMDWSACFGANVPDVIPSS